MLLAEKNGLVTGAGKGLGREIARKLAAEGCTVLLAGRREEPLLETQRMIEAEGGRAFCFPADLSEDEQVEALASAVLKQFGRLDILVNNAGIAKEYDLLHMPIEVWDELYRVNLRAVMLVTKAFLPSMTEQGSGSIVNIGSGAGLRGLPGNIAYSVAKAGVICFTQTLGDEVRKYGIRANVICPGPINTEMFKKSDSREFILAAGGDVFEPETIANAVVFLASDLSAGMNSQILTMRGFNRW